MSLVTNLAVSEPLELIEQALRCEDSDRTPVVPLVGLHSSVYSDMDVLDLVQDADAQSKSQLMALRKFGYDGVFTCMDLTMEAEALGAAVDFPENAFPYVRQHPIDEPLDILELEMPPVVDTRMNIFVDTAEKLVKEVGETHLVSSYMIGPFTLAGHLLGVEEMLELSMEEQDQTKSIVGHCQELLVPLVEKFAEVGTHNIVILEPTASSSIISPRFFQKYSQPYLAKLVDGIQRRGAKATVHICGNTLPIISAMCDTGADALSLDSVVDLSEAKVRSKGRSGIMGNVDTSLMLTGTPKEIHDAARDCLDKAAKGGGYILSTGCDLPLETPPVNLQALVDVVGEV